MFLYILDVRVIDIDIVIVLCYLLGSRPIRERTGAQTNHHEDIQVDNDHTHNIQVIIAGEKHEETFPIQSVKDVEMTDKKP